MRQTLILDLMCLQKVCAFRPKHFDQNLIRDHLDQITQEFVYIRDKRDKFSSESEYLKFCLSVATLTEGTTEIIKALQHREELHLLIQKEKQQAVARETHPSYRHDLSPWSQFLTKGAPALPMAHFVAPLPIRPPLDPEYPLVCRVRSTSVQALPQATTAILARWAWEFKNAIDYYHRVSKPQTACLLRTSGYS